MTRSESNGDLNKFLQRVVMPGGALHVISAMRALAALYSDAADMLADQSGREGLDTERVDRLASVPLGARFVFRTAELVGEQSDIRKPPYEGQVLTVVGFKPRYTNNVVVRDAHGKDYLMPSEMVQKALKLHSS